MVNAITIMLLTIIIYHCIRLPSNFLQTKRTAKAILSEIHKSYRQFPSLSQPQVEPFPPKGLCSKRGSNLESSHPQGSGSGLPQGGSGLLQGGVCGSSQPQPDCPIRFPF